MSSETVGNVTKETMHYGLSGELRMTNGFGTIAFGTISGGGGAILTKGNFWQGAISGFFVSALNHVAHGGENSENLLYSRRYAKDENGNVISESLNYFPSYRTNPFVWRSC
ncbi:hypothetical protein BXU10_14065 [Flavobacterium sp. LM4]|nr:hypothetical protein BXU10_14065 [Flavobacterium sp. LM4]